jgi:hypothetical protein
MTDLELAQIVDKVGLWVSLGVPVILVWRFRWWGILAGAFFQWILLVVVGDVLQELDPARDAALTDSIWFFFGWIGALVYCLAVFAVLQLAKWLMSMRRASA